MHKQNLVLPSSRLIKKTSLLKLPSCIIRSDRLHQRHLVRNRENVQIIICCVNWLDNEFNHLYVWLFWGKFPRGASSGQDASGRNGIVFHQCRSADRHVDRSEAQADKSGGDNLTSVRLPLSPSASLKLVAAVCHRANKESVVFAGERLKRWFMLSVHCISELSNLPVNNSFKEPQ